MSPNTCAIWRLSTRETVPLDAEIEQARTALSQRLADGALPLGRSVTEQATAAAGTAYLGSGRARPPRPIDEAVNRRRRNARRQALASVPLGRDRRAHTVPVLLSECVTHRRRGVANALEAVEHVAVAVDMLLRNLPVVGAGIARLAGVAEHQPRLQFRNLDIQRDAADAVDVQFERGNAAVQRRPVILQPGRDADRLRLDVHRHLQQRFRFVMRALPFR